MDKKVVFKQRIAAIFAPLEIDEYRECKAHKKLTKAPWVEFTLQAPYGEPCYGVTFESLNRLKRLLRAQEIEVNGWSEGIDGPNTIAIVAYFVNFGK